ncbi:MAG: twitching motility protein PilT [Metallosphaera sp.]|uniref:type II toxin-antitoxin system VapC family toxin n=1 Tax=Metallosphaera sp. TaxID=2020860 RepID=UPI0031662460
MEIGRMGSSDRIGVLVDTNILMSVYDKVDPFDLILEKFSYKPRFYIHKLVLKELDILFHKYNKSTKITSKLSLARKYLEVYRTWWEEVDMHSDLPTDDALLETAKDLGLIIFTNDECLRKRAKMNNVEIISLGRGGKVIKSFHTI